MINVESISKFYQDQKVISDVSFTVDKGETLVLLGTSGSGKTTVLKMINRLIEPDAGRIQIDQEDIQQSRPEVLRRKIGYVIQQSGLFPHYSVGQNIGLVPSLLKWSTQRMEQRTHELLQVVGLSASLYNRYPHELSGGQQQRVGIARALAADPPIILMDEPFGALDPITKQQMSREFASLGMLRKKTVVLVTHDVLEAFTLGDRVCLLDEGKIQQWGTPKDLLFSPKNDFVRSFFATQRLRLAMEVLLIIDIINFCPSENNMVAGSPIQVTESASIFSVLSTMEERKASKILVEQKNANAIVLNRSQLLQGFFSYQEAV